ncbi:hypothetical protein UA38_22500 [Photobacterium kishitanii]|uniref:ImpA N-terminal domain-containing protein n=1 Tax=Photobacterium kishitanii TaxID=318456 RepID=A0AAX0YZJ3_9GAMM|nr:type VI secretion system ImpA family N-terminal domain-containing protein [Photobacterium kishitanii]KJG53500.1 hypothetical protein UA38_22500 [Photobacterium kishitanii]KJG62895.1 hypothetical protein UA42_00340 [Photobacterium kishitanii]KJG63416.1 hypothetical protein UA40_22135 [Photobacterium kishitanii]KJG68801.1 hypothetical protein UA41_15350 [Photobacterium kishitanii]PSX16973.1 hypothetical protein C0W70_21825 [Photobacterium kishitanii]
MGFYQSRQFKFVDDESKLRNSTRYQLIRDEINRLNNPSYGKIDWDKIKMLCEDLARTDGLNFLTTLYYTTALVKEQGVSGLANGLELQLAALMHLYENKDVNLVKCADLYRWMIARIGDELRRLEPKESQLKDLYRCERCCKEIYELFLDVHPQHVPDLEAISYVIFEHVDYLEGKLKLIEADKQNHINEQQDIPPKLPLRNKHRIRLSWVFCLGLLLGLSVFAVKDYLRSTTNSLLKRVTAEKLEAQVLTSEQIAQLQHQYSPSVFTDNKATIIPLYLRQANDEINALSGKNIAQALSLMNTVKQLYPNDAQIEQHQQYIADIRERFETQYRRFKTARTNIANLQQTMNQSHSNKLAALSGEINDYAISLSPVYGRISYIEQQIANKNQPEVQKELQQLDGEIKGLELKFSQLTDQSKNI